MKISTIAVCLAMLSAGLPSSSAHAAPSDATATQLDAGEANVAIVKRFLTDLRAAITTRDPAKIRAVAERYMAADYIQHSSAFPPGREGYIAVMTKFASSPPQGGGGPPKDLQFVGNRDYVMWMSEAPPEPGTTSPRYTFNMFRIAGGKLMEHWGSM